MRGRIEIAEIFSAALEGNPLNDSMRRQTPIYVPAEYVNENKHLPVVYFLHGFTGSGMSWLNASSFTLNVPQRLDRLIEKGIIPPCLGVFVDGWTALGGSQWINSEAIGAYRDYLVRDVVGWVDKHYRTVRSAEGRAVIGKSSGGYGAWVMGAHHPEVFGHIGAQSADSYFEYGYLPEFPKAADALRLAGGPEAWFRAMTTRAAETRMKGADHAVINVVAMSAAYSPKKGLPLNLELPFEPYTARLKEEVWQRWLENDPVRFVPKHLASFRQLNSIFVDCGSRDEFHLQYGSRMVLDALRQGAVEVMYEEFDDGHMGINYRVDKSLSVIVPKMKQE